MIPTEISKYNIRTYGLWINHENCVLVSDEFRLNTPMTKFPGGGHHFGEGLGDAVKREWKEELNLDIEIDKLYYINDFLQISAFNPKEQLLSVYFLVRPLSDQIPHFPLSTKSIVETIEGVEKFRWLPISSVTPNDFTFPVDKVVAAQLFRDYGVE